jgi:kynurenine formamidase
MKQVGMFFGMLFFFHFALAYGQEKPAPNFTALMEQVSNWNQWGSTDQKGTLNYSTPELRKAALNEIKQGAVLSIAFPMDTTATAYNRNPLKHAFFKGDLWKGSEFNADAYEVAYHGSMHTHVDGLTHITHNGKLYNGYSTTTIAETGATKLGVEHWKNGIVGRAVLIDLPYIKNIEYLPSGTPIYAKDLQEFESKTGMRLQAGDIVLVYTGRWKEWATQPHWEPFSRLAGLHYSAMAYLHNKKVMVLGSDGINDVFPSGHPTESAPVHKLALVAMGMPLLDNLNLEAAVTAARKEKKWTFFFMASPLIVNGGTGSPLNPILMYE